MNPQPPVTSALLTLSPAEKLLCVSNTQRKGLFHLLLQTFWLSPGRARLALERTKSGPKRSVQRLLSEAELESRSGEAPEGRRAAHLARPLVRNIAALMERREEEIAQAAPSEKVATAIAEFTGSMRSVVLHGLVFGLWILINLGILPIVEPWDPTFVVLAMIASVEAIFLSTFVLMNQNRLARVEDRRSELTLQISLLAEHEMTKVVGVVSEIAKHLDVPTPVHSELEELAEEVIPEAVLDEIDRKRPE